MIGKNEFIELINWGIEQNKRVDELAKVIPGCYDAEIFDSPFKLLDLIFNICFDEEGIGWIDWYLYDSYHYLTNTYNRTYTDENGVDINVDTVDKLWDLVKSCRK